MTIHHAIVCTTCGVHGADLDSCDAVTTTLASMALRDRRWVTQTNQFHYCPACVRATGVRNLPREGHTT